MNLKSAIIPLLFFFALSNLSFAQDNMEGTWLSIKRTLVIGESEPILTEGDAASNMIKVINKSHFVTIIQSEPVENSLFNGGKYDIDTTAGTYTENLSFCSNPTQIGESNTFKSTVKDGIWTIEGPIETEDGAELPEWKVHETFKRID